MKQTKPNGLPKDMELTRTQSLPPTMKVSVGPVGLPSSVLVQNSNGIGPKEWSSELFSRDERQSLKRALKTTDPIYKLHQVYNKNLINVDGSNISLQLRKRRQSAREMRKALISEDLRRRTTHSAQESERPSFPGDLGEGRDTDTEAMVARLQPEDREGMGLLLEKHKELRRKKSATSFRRSGVSGRPSLLEQQRRGSSDSTVLPPISVLEEKDETSSTDL